MKVKVEYEITGQQIADLMTTAIEQGYDWFGYVSLLKGATEAKENTWYADPKLWDGDFQIEVEELDDDGYVVESHVIDTEKFQKGLQVLADQFPKVFANITGDNHDANTADMMLQCICFGEEKYA